jgi:hypothetical protein
MLDKLSLGDSNGIMGFPFPVQLLLGTCDGRAGGCSTCTLQDDESALRSSLRPFIWKRDLCLIPVHGGTALPLQSA